MLMRLRKLLLLVTVLVTSVVPAVIHAPMCRAAAHPFHTSLAEVEWNDSTGRFEVALQVNSLDLEHVLSAIAGDRVNLDVTAVAEPHVRNYLESRFRISTVSTDFPTFHWVGMELEKLELWAYFEIQPAGTRNLPQAPAAVDIRPAVTLSHAATSVTPARQLVPAAGSSSDERPANQWRLPDRVRISNTVLLDLRPLQVNYVTLTAGRMTESAHLTQDAPEVLFSLNRNREAQPVEQLPAGSPDTTSAVPLSVIPTSLQRQPAADEFPAVPGMKQILHTDFSEADAITRWELTDPTAWKPGRENDASFLSLTKKQSDFAPPHRSPFNRALRKDLTVGSFVMDVRLRSTIPDYNHRDVCLFFGYQDDAHLYYVHLGKRTDDHANLIFIVNDAPRVKISTQTTDGIPWDDEWHRVRVVRKLETGEISVYFDDMQAPVMRAVDRTFGPGRIGVGSFDDTGDYGTVTVWVSE